MYNPSVYPPPPPIASKPREGDYGLTVVIIFIIDLLVTAALIGALLCPSYHYTTLAFITGATINFNVGLWNVQTSGNAGGWFGRLQPRQVTQLLTNVIESLDKKDLSEFQTFACYMDSLFLQMIPSGCNTIIVLRVASYILASCLIIAAVLIFFGGVTLLIFWFNRRTLLSRRLTYFLHIIPGFAVIVGLAVYLIVGGINLDFAVNIPGIVADVSPVDLSSGFFAATGAGILCLTVPAFMYFLIPDDLCLDSRKQFELEDAREDDALLQALTYERQQLNTFYNPPYASSHSLPVVHAHQPYYHQQTFH